MLLEKTVTKDKNLIELIFEKNIEDSEVRKVLEEIINEGIFEKKIEDSEIRKVLEEILHKEKFKNNLEIKCAEKIQKISKLDKRCIKKILDKVLDNEETRTVFYGQLSEPDINKNISEILKKIGYEKKLRLVYEEIENEKEPSKKVNWRTNMIDSG